jgi:hypothetical protein
MGFFICNQIVVSWAIGFGPVGPTIFKCDNQSTIKLIKSPIFHDKSKHFEKDWHFARQQVE